MTSVCSRTFHLHDHHHGVAGSLIRTTEPEPPPTHTHIHRYSFPFVTFPPLPNCGASCIL